MAQLTPPPRSSKVRDYAAEQWEKEASSGTRDKRVSEQTVIIIIIIN